ncbi:MAG: type 4a pilus biogenesis protein PilO [Vicinamibacterales bacterium]
MDLKLTKLPWYAQLGIFVGIAAVAGGLFFYYYDTPKRAELATRQRQLATLQADNAKGRATAAKLPEFRADVAELESRLSTLKTILPEEKDAAELLRGLQGIAVQSNLTIKAFKPAATVTKQLHSEWPISLDLEGTYHNLALFYDRVGKMARIINISGLDMRTHPMPDTNSTITATCTATTFVLLDNPPAPPAPAGRGGRGA